MKKSDKMVKKLNNILQRALDKACRKIEVVQSIKDHIGPPTNTNAAKNK